jgi:hypothetical protein
MRKETIIMMIAKAGEAAYIRVMREAPMQGPRSLSILLLWILTVVKVKKI